MVVQQAVNLPYLGSSPSLAAKEDKVNIADIERAWKFECAERDRKPLLQDGMMVTRSSLADGFMLYATSGGVLWACFIDLFDAMGNTGGADEAIRHAMRNPVPIQEW